MEEEKEKEKKMKFLKIAIVLAILFIPVSTIAFDGVFENYSDKVEAIPAEEFKTDQLQLYGFIYIQVEEPGLEKNRQHKMWIVVSIQGYFMIGEDISVPNENGRTVTVTNYYDVLYDGVVDSVETSIIEFDKDDKVINSKFGEVEQDEDIIKTKRHFEIADMIADIINPEKKKEIPEELQAI